MSDVSQDSWTEFFLESAPLREDALGVEMEKAMAAAKPKPPLPLKRLLEDHFSPSKASAFEAEIEAWYDGDGGEVAAAVLDKDVTEAHMQAFVEKHLEVIRLTYRATQSLSLTSFSSK